MTKGGGLKLLQIQDDGIGISVRIFALQYCPTNKRSVISSRLFW